MVKITLATLLASVASCLAGQITSDQFLIGTLGSPFTYQITADNQPISFDAVGLPPGLSIDRATGVISGVPTISGFNPYFQVIAHGASGDAQKSCNLFVYRPVPYPDPVNWTSARTCSQMIGDPSRPRLYCLTNDAVVVIDTDSLQEVKSVPTGQTAVAMKLSSDNRTLWISRTTLTTSVARLDLNALDQVVEVPVADRVYQPQEGMDDRLYVAGGNQEILQLNARTGTIEQRFKPGEQFPHVTYPTLAISPDRKTLYVADLYYVGDSLVTHVGLSRYDVASPVPLLLQRVEIPAPTIGGITPDPTGESVFFSLGTFDGDGSGATHQTMCVSAHDLSAVRGNLSYQGTSGGLSITGDGRTVLQIVQLSNGGQWNTGLVDIFDAQTFQLTKSIVLGSRGSIGGGAFVGISGVAMSSDGQNLFASTDIDPGYLRMYNLTPPPAPPSPPKSFLNISTRLLTETGDDVLIGGFIVTGAQAKKVALRGIGTSLPISGKLADPVLELHRSDGSLVADNDNWNSHRQDVLETGIAPTEEREAAIVLWLPPDAYTMVLKGVGDSTGIAVVEAYDLSPSSTSRLANISTRGFVQTGDNVMIGGWIIGGDESTNVAVRAIGPSLVNNGINSPLSDPMLEVHDGNGALLAENDDWRSNQQEMLVANGLAPTDDREAAIILSLQPGNYTAVVRGKSGATGVALVEVYDLL